MGLNTIVRAHLARYRGRSALVVLGLAMAVAAFVGMVSLVVSLHTTVEDRLARFGSSLTVVPRRAQLSLEYGGISVATVGSAQALSLEASVLSAVQSIPSRAQLAAVLPVSLHAAQVSGVRSLVIGTDVASATTVKPWWEVVGAVIADPDHALIGLNARNRLGVDPGDRLTIGRRSFVVGGVLKETGGEEDNAIIVERTALATALGVDPSPNLIEVVVSNQAAVDTVLREIESAVPTVEVRSVKKSLEFKERATSSLAAIGLGATVLVILVATLVVVLTMVAAVRERTKEIGVLRALGFRARDVVSLLFRESLVLGGAAAMAGAGLGVVGALYGPSLIPRLELEPAIRAPIVGGGLLLAIVLATAATIYPAWLATRIEPAVALRKI